MFNEFCRCKVLWAYASLNILHSALCTAESRFFYVVLDTTIEVASRLGGEGAGRGPCDGKAVRERSPAGRRSGREVGLGGDGTSRRGSKVEVLEELAEQLIGLLTGEVEEADGQGFEVTHTLDVLVVQVVVDAVVGLQRRSLDSCHSCC